MAPGCSPTPCWMPWSALDAAVPVVTSLNWRPVSCVLTLVVIPVVYYAYEYRAHEAETEQAPPAATTA